MKSWVVGVMFAVVFALFGFAPARSDSGCAAALQVFRQADDDFSQADKGDKTAWQRGNAIVAEHRGDIAPVPCDIDEFEVMRLVAMEHGLRTGFSLGTVDGAEAVGAADRAYEVTLFNARSRRLYMDVRADLQRRFGDSMRRSHDYLWDLAQAYRANELASFTAHRAGGCSAPNQDATALIPVTPEFPTKARFIGKEVTALVRVDMLPNGDLKQVTVQQSSGNAAIDDAALQAARKTFYAPKIVNCTPVAGTYLFRSTFSPGPG